MSRRAYPSATSLLALTVGLATELPAQEWRIFDLEGTRIPGRPVGFADGALQIASDGGQRAVALGDLEALEHTDAAPLAGTLPQGRVWLRSGLALPARALAGVESPAGGTAVRTDVGLGEDHAVDLPLIRLAALRFASTESAGDYRGFEEALQSPPTTEDLLFAIDTRRDRITRLSVRVLGFAAGALQVEFRGREEALPYDQVHGIVLGTDHGIAPEPLAEPTVAITLAPRDGAAIHVVGRITGLADGRLRVATADGFELPLPLASVARIAVRSDKLAWLSQREPAKAEQVAAFDQTRPWLRDRAPGGEGFVLGGETYGRGLCLIPRTRLEFALDPGRFDVFEAVVGIDERGGGGQANATLRVLLDDEVVWEAEAVSRATPPARLRLPLNGAARLVLEADFGKNFDLGDHCAFAQARLLKL